MLFLTDDVFVKRPPPTFGWEVLVAVFLFYNLFLIFLLRVNRVFLKIPSIYFNIIFNVKIKLMSQKLLFIPDLK